MLSIMKHFYLIPFVFLIGCSSVTEYGGVFPVPAKLDVHVVDSADGPIHEARLDVFLSGSNDNFNSEIARNNSMSKSGDDDLSDRDGIIEYRSGTLEICIRHNELFGWRLPMHDEYSVGPTLDLSISKDGYHTKRLTHDFLQQECRNQGIDIAEVPGDSTCKVKVNLVARDDG